jgi:cell division protein FtsQ
MDPRILARWVAVRQGERKRRWRLAKVALGVTTVIAAAWLVARSPVGAVQQVEVHGGVHTARAAVLAAAGLDRRQQMVDVDAGAVRRKVAALPWVAQVSVSRHWPTTLTIGITERVPRAKVAETAGQLVFVDGEGRVLAPVDEVGATPGARGDGLPVLVGLAPAGAPGTTLDPSSGAALALLRTLSTLPIDAAASPPPAIGHTLSAVLRDTDGTLHAAYLPGPIDVVFGSADSVAAKLVDVRSLLAGLAAGTPATIDVRVADAPVLTNGKISSMVSTTQRG